MFMYSRLPKFSYFAPRKAEEACSFLSEHKGKVKVLAGGTDVINRMRKREVVPEYVMSLKNVEGMDYIRYEEGQGIRIGALTTIHSVENSPVIKAKCNILHQGASVMACREVRNVATIGGNICNASPSADTAPALLTLNAKLRVLSAEGERVIPTEEFFMGPGETALRPDEILTEIQIDEIAGIHAGTYIKHTIRRAMDLAIVGVAVLVISGRGVGSVTRIGLGAVAPTPIRAKKAEDILSGKDLEPFLMESAAQTSSEEANPISDVRASAAYRKEMVRVLTQRAILEAWTWINPS
jgi:carbon-monoxide dehydrogenase medium subunit